MKMDMKVVTPPPADCSTPYMSAACSPRHPLDFFFYSAPTSPRSFGRSMFDDGYATEEEEVALLKNEHDVTSAVPFGSELKPKSSASLSHDDQKNEATVVDDEQEKDDFEFEFEFNGQLDLMVKPCLSSADELFDGGKIRPLKPKPPPSSENNHSPKSAMSKFKDALSVSPKHRRRGDPFEAAANNNDNELQNRGRPKPANPKRAGRKGISRSLSPLRVSEFALLHHQHLQDQQSTNDTSNSGRFLGRGTSTSTSTSTSSKKWSLKDLFLFRSASEGHYKDTQSFSKRWSFKSSATSSVSESGSLSKRRGQQGASAHEMHYTTNKAVSEEMKKKTSLPYKHGLLACLGFSPILPQFSYTFPSSAS